MVNKVYVDWADVYAQANRLSHRWEQHVEDQYINSVYGVPRGGVPVAIIVSHILEIPLADEIEPGVLIVDDILDTGRTWFRLGEPRNFDTLFRKPYPVNVILGAPAQGAHEVTDWIVFPWEMEDVEGKYERLEQQYTDLQTKYVQLADKLEGVTTERDNLKAKYEFP